MQTFSGVSCSTRSVAGLVALHATSNGDTKLVCGQATEGLAMERELARGTGGAAVVLHLLHGAEMGFLHGLSFLLDSTNMALIAGRCGREAAQWCGATD
jgi:hypothetical protein